MTKENKANLSSLKDLLIEYLYNCEKSLDWAKLVFLLMRYEKHLIDFEKEKKKLELFLSE